MIFIVLLAIKIKFRSGKRKRNKIHINMKVHFVTWHVLIKKNNSYHSMSRVEWSRRRTNGNLKMKKIVDLHWLGKGEKKVLSFFGFKSQNPWKKIVFLCPTKLIINYELCESKRSSSQLDHNLHFRAPGIPFSLLKESLSLETPLLKAKNHESKKTRQSFESIWNFGLVLLVDIV